MHIQVVDERTPLLILFCIQLKHSLQLLVQFIFILVGIRIHVRVHLPLPVLVDTFGLHKLLLLSLICHDFVHYLLLQQTLVSLNFLFKSLLFILSEFDVLYYLMSCEVAALVGEVLGRWLCVEGVRLILSGCGLLCVSAQVVVLWILESVLGGAVAAD